MPRGGSNNREFTVIIFIFSLYTFYKPLPPFKNLTKLNKVGIIGEPLASHIFYHHIILYYIPSSYFFVKKEEVKL